MSTLELKRGAGAPLTPGVRYPLRYLRNGTQRTGTLSLPTPLTVTAAIPVIGGGIGVRVRGLAVRFHYVIVMR